MASFDDLGRALRDDASTNAPAASVINVDAVISAARARRRPRQWAVGTLSIVAALGLGGLAVAAVTPPTMLAATESGDDSDVLLSEESAEGGAGAPSAADDGRATDLLGCGTEVPMAQPGTTDLSLEVRLPSSAFTRKGIVEGVARVTNTGPSAASFITATEASGVLAQDDRIVGERIVFGESGLTLELGAGESRDLPVRFSTSSCDDGSALTAGEYTVAVVLEVVDGSAVSLIVAPIVELRLD